MKKKEKKEKHTAQLGHSSSWDHRRQPLKGDVTPHITIPCASQFRDGCYVRQELDCFSFPSVAMSEPGQSSPSPGQAPSANCTWPGASPAPPELCHRRSWCWERAMRACQECDRRLLQPGKASPRGYFRGVFSAGEFWMAKGGLSVFLLPWFHVKNLWCFFQKSCCVA